MKSLRAARQLGRGEAGRGQHHLPRRARAAAGVRRRQGRLYRPCLPNDAAGGRAAGLADAVDGFCEGIAFSPEQIARVFEAAKALGLPVKLHADQLSNLHGAALAASYRRAVGRSSRIHRRGGRRGDGQGRHGRGAPAGRLLFHPRDEEAADRPLPQARRADGDRHRLQSGHLAADVVAAGHEHGCDAVRHDRGGVHRRRHARSRARTRTAATTPGRWRPARLPTLPSGISNARPNSSIAWASIRCIARVWRGK